MWLVLSTMTVTGESDKEIKSMAFTPCSFLLLFRKYFFMTASVNGKLTSIDTKIANITINAYARDKTQIINALNTYNAQIPFGICIVNFKPDSDKNYYSGVITQKINDTYGIGIVLSYYNTETMLIRFDNRVWNNA